MSVFRYIGMATVVVMVLSGCGGSSSSTPQGPFSVGGSVSGLAGAGLVLNDGTEDLAVGASGTFTFPTKLATGTAYAVTVKAQPTSPLQTCTVSNGSGTIGTANVTNVAVACATNRYAVGGTVAGLAGSGLKLRNNGGDEIDVAAGATTFAFPTRLEAGAAYAVTVTAQPTSPSQSCTVTNASGTVGASDVTSVAVTCATSTFTVKGTLAGLAGGSVGLRLTVGTAAENLTLAGNGPFVFTSLAASGATFTVSVTAQPASPPQVCSIAPTSGTVGDADVVLQVVCATNAFRVSGTVAGLLGSGLVLTNNGGDDLAISGNGSFAFPGVVANGATFLVAVKVKPANPSQTCAIANGSGVIGGADVTNVQVTCTTDSFAVGGTVSGLAGTLVLQNNGGNDLTVVANGPFAFTIPIESGRGYAVTVRTNPASPVVQTCTVANGAGTVVAGPVTSVVVTCASNKFQVGGTVTGLNGTLVLRNNGGDDLTVTANGPFAFGTLLDSGAAYAVTVLTNPSSPVSQACTVTSGSGTVGTGPVTGVQVACVTNRFAVGGTLSGLASGESVVLQNNVGDDLTLTADGPFAFGTTIASGGAYSVTVRTQPSSPIAQTCTVTNGSGTVGAAAVASVQVSCQARPFTVGGTLTGLAASSSVVLRNNGGDDLTLSANGPFNFATGVASGQAYAVTVLTNPSSPVSQACTVAAGNGTVAGADVSTVQVSCVTNTFAVGGTLSGLASGQTVVLQNNAGDDLTLTVDGPFTFATPVASGAAYSVSVRTNPASQACTVTSGSGTVGAAAIASVQVGCVTQTVIRTWAAPTTWGGTAQGFWPDDDPTLVQHAVVTATGIEERKLPGVTQWQVPTAVRNNIRPFTGFGPGLTRHGAGFANGASYDPAQASPPTNPLNALVGNMIACAVVKPDWDPADLDERVIFANGIQGESGWVLMQMHEAWCFHYQGVNLPVQAYNSAFGEMNYANTWFDSLSQSGAYHVPDTGPLNPSFVVVCGGRDETTGQIIVAANNFQHTQMASVPTAGLGPMAVNPHPLTMGNYAPFNPLGASRNDWDGRVYETAVWDLPATRENVQAKMNQVLGLVALQDGTVPAYRRDTEAPFYGPDNPTDNFNNVAANPTLLHTAYRHGPRLDATRGLLFGLQALNHVAWPETLNWWTQTAGTGGAPAVTANASALPFPPGDSEIRSGDVVRLPAGASLRIALEPFTTDARPQGQIWICPQSAGTLTVRSEATTTPFNGTPTVASRGVQSVTLTAPPPAGCTWTRVGLVGTSGNRFIAEPQPIPTVPPAPPAPTVVQTLILENQGAAEIAFGAWGISMGQVSPALGLTVDLGIANYDSLIGGAGAEFLDLGTVPSSTAGGFCLSATAQPAAQTPWSYMLGRPRGLVALDKVTPGPTPVESFSKLVVMGSGDTQWICYYVTDGVTSSRVCTDVATQVPAWSGSSQHNIKGCIGGNGQLRLYLDGTEVPPGNVAYQENNPRASVPDFAGASIYVGSNEYGAHVWSGWIKSASVCRAGGTLADCP